eukprot:TRINITY_DN11727_c0_g1_i1.p1 TRINITY_DN11727_c0_g1~~TRINITY_DN11727_c0_g1_i1.p1  ORF type:complete len:201 (+),score=28.73 TRINITY_DN11727_c0_g1_i1:23-625(+)
MTEESKVIEAKICLLGHTGVGKTSLVSRYCNSNFTTATTSTVGGSFNKKEIELDGHQIILQIWDTAGQERFRSMAPLYYRGAHCAILVYDVTSTESLEKVSGWVAELQSINNEDPILVLAANKSDLRGTMDPSSCVSSEKAASFAKAINAEVFDTSAKTGKGVDDLFNYIVRSLLTRNKNKANRGVLTPPTLRPDSKGCC